MRRRVGVRQCETHRLEQLEPRCLLVAGPLHVGIVYTEEDLGTDQQGDLFEVTFQGGADQTELTALVIDGNQVDPTFGMGDVFFDTIETGNPGDQWGADHAFTLTVVSNEGIDQVDWTVDDGTTTLSFRFVGFHAGDRLLFSIDVDEVEEFDPNETDPEYINDGFDPITSGVEFQGSTLQAEFSAPSFHDASASTTFRNRYDDLLEQSRLDLPTDNAHGKRDRTAGAFASVTQQPLPVTLSGSVFEDVNLDLRRDPTEPALADVILELWQRVSDDHYESTGWTTTTDQGGRYEFGSGLKLAPGHYQVREHQPDGYFSVGAMPGRLDDGEIAGVVASDDIVSEIALLRGGMRADQIDFAEARPVELSGYVYHDRNEDADRQPDEDGIAGSLVRVVPVDTIDDSIGPVDILSDADGRFHVDGLPPGRYRIEQAEQPTHYLDGEDRPGTVDGVVHGIATNPGDQIGAIDLQSGESGVDYRFGEVLPVTLRGRIEASDENGNCFVGDHTTHGVAGVVVTLYDEETNLRVATVVTDAEGFYEFTSLYPGDYRIVESTPAGWLDGPERVGTVNGTPRGTVIGNDVIGSITLRSGENGVFYDFCEHQPVSLRGHVFHDRDNDGIMESGEEGIDNVVVSLRNDQGEFVRSVTTDTHGIYEFIDLLPGRYEVVEEQPAGWRDGKEQLGRVDDEPSGIAHNDRFTEIWLPSGAQGVDYNFGEWLPISLSGNVHFSDEHGDCFGEGVVTEPLPGATILLFDMQGQQVAETVSGAQGQYAFRDLEPGTYRVVEITPDGLFEGGAQAGFVNQLTVGVIDGANSITEITLRSGDQAVEYDFCDHEPATLSGNVYHDRNGDGHRGPNEEGIGGTDVALVDEQGNILQTMTTDSNGAYHFQHLLPGRYAIVEQQPIGWLDGQEELGRVNGHVTGSVASNDRFEQITLPPGSIGTEYNFGEYLPVSLAGTVHSDPDQDCEIDSGEVMLEGVRIELWQGESLIASETTDREGRYRFDGLPPGIYTLREVQPVGYFQGGQVAGTSGGYADRRDVISEIALPSGVTADDYQFCEVPPSQLSGYVFQDGPAVELAHDQNLPDDISELRDGARTPDDLPLAGITLELRHGVTGQMIDADVALDGYYSPGPIRTVSDANGFYLFDGLPRGNYAVFQVHPPGFTDGIDTPGTTDGIADNVHTPLSPAVAAALEQPTFHDAILRIPLPPGVHSRENNFSEIVARKSQPFVPFNPPPRTPIPEAVDLAVATWEPITVDRQMVFLPTVARREPYVPRAIGYTWHLSVTNGGHPRSATVESHAGTQGEKPPVWIPVEWTHRPRAGKLWKLWVRGDRLVRISPIYFGGERARPVAGDFNGDGKSEIGTFEEGQWMVDLNGNGEWDNDDLWARLGYAGDLPVVGDWDGDGKDDIGIFGRAWPGDPRAVAEEPGLPDGQNQAAGRPKNLPPDEQDATRGRRELQATAKGPIRTDLIDHVFHYGVAGDAPVTGDWNGDGIHTIAIFRNGVWRLDVDGDGQWSGQDRRIVFGHQGDIPVRGDWNGDGVDDVAVFRDGTFWLDSNANGQWDSDDERVETGTEGRPAVGDWDGDGRDDIAVMSETDATPEPREARTSRPSVR